MKYNSDFKYDLEFGRLNGETWLHELISNSTIEVKTDRKTSTTGNIYIEYECRGKPSGISTSQADFWAIKITESTAILMSTKELKQKLKELIESGLAKKDIAGGDNNLSKGILTKVEYLIKQ